MNNITNQFTTKNTFKVSIYSIDYAYVRNFYGKNLECIEFEKQ